MVDIMNNAIKIVAGDTARIRLELNNYNLDNGDSVKFTAYDVQTSQTVITVTITEFDYGDALISLSSADTDIAAGTYLYDIQVTLANGDIDTVIIGPLTIIRGGTQ